MRSTRAGVLRVVHVIRSVSSEHGGPSVTVPALCEGLGALTGPVDLHVTDTFVPPVDARLVRVHGHRCVPGGDRLGLSWELHRALVAAGREADIIHSHGLWLPPNLDVNWATRGGRAKLVLSPRGMLEAYALERRRMAKCAVWMLGQRAAVRAAACIHVTSDSEHDAVRAAGLKNPVAVIPNGVSLPAPLAASGARRALRRLLFLGRLDHKKGVDFLLEAWARVAPEFPQWELTVVGPSTGDYGRALEVESRARAVPRIRFEGPRYGADRDRELAEAELFVLPTRSENFGMTVAEALAAGTPVICSKGAPWSRLEREDCGTWIDIGSEPLVRCLRETLTLSPEELVRRGARGRAWMEREYAWRVQAEKMFSVYRWLWGGEARPECVRSR